MSENTAYGEFIGGLLAQPEQPFSPFVEYDPDGDCIEFFLKAEPFYAERVDGLLTVYKNQDTNEIVGSQIKRVSALCKEILGKFPGFRVEIHDGKVPLVHIFRVQLWKMPSQPNEIIHIYKFLAAKAEEVGAEVDEHLFAAC